MCESETVLWPWWLNTGYCFRLSIALKKMQDTRKAMAYDGVAFISHATFSQSTCLHTLSCGHLVLAEGQSCVVISFLLDGMVHAGEASEDIFRPEMKDWYCLLNCCCLMRKYLCLTMMIPWRTTKARKSCCHVSGMI